MPTGIPKRSRLCELCGCEYQPTSGRQLWCLACRQQARHEYNAAYAENPENRERQRAWWKANPERVKAYQNRCYRWPCPGCGKVRRVPSWAVGKEAKAAVLCLRCSGVARRKMIRLRCHWCEAMYTTRACYVAGTRHSCPECSGARTKARATLGVSRQRVHQLMYEEYRLLNRNGQYATRAKALAAIIERRRASCTT